MLSRKLSDYEIILGSASPRRHELLKKMAIPFTVKVRSITEVYPKNLKGFEITNYLAKEKAKAFIDLAPNQILITSDTIVWKDNTPIEKPLDATQATKMLQTLSNTTHTVYTSVCVTTIKAQLTQFAEAQVTFKALSDAEIAFYIDHFKPFDKAGAYGVQDWMGAIAITHIQGSYFTVMGLPTHLLYSMLQRIV